MIARRSMLAGAGLLAAPGILRAQEAFPTRPVRVLVPFPPGGATDIIARLVCERLSARWGQPVVIENRPGAGTIVGTQAIARSAPDGYTFGYVISAHTINPALRNDLPYDTLRDFAPITQVARAHVVLAAHPSVPANDMRELADLARRTPGGMAVATPGIGTVMHMIMELMAAATGAEFTHVPYQGGAAALTDVMANRVPLILDPWHSTRPHVEGGRLKVIAAASATPVPGAPHIPLMNATFPGLEAFSVVGVVGPAGMPPGIARKIQEDTRAVMAEPATAERMASVGLEPVGNLPEEWGAFIAADIERWRSLVRTRNIRLN
jgi:tripartite-type tricarboxylate transporter receptor subunit TctC